MPLGEGFEPRQESPRKEARQAVIEKLWKCSIKPWHITRKTTAVDGSCDEIINEIKEVKENEYLRDW